MASSAVYTPSSEDVRLYECAVLYPYPMGQKEEQQLMKDIEKLFEEAGAKLILKDPWGRRGLAYKIGGYTEGCFVMFYYEMDPGKLREIDQQLRILKGVLRHLFVKPPKNYEVKSYAGLYDQWLERQKAEETRRLAEKEERLKKQVVDKAKRMTKRTDVRKKADEEVAKPAPTGEAIGKELDKLIAEDGIDL